MSLFGKQSWNLQFGETLGLFGGSRDIFLGFLIESGAILRYFTIDYIILQYFTLVFDFIIIYIAFKNTLKAEGWFSKNADGFRTGIQKTLRCIDHIRS